MAPTRRRSDEGLVDTDEEETDRPSKRRQSNGSRVSNGTSNGHMDTDEGNAEETAFAGKGKGRHLNGTTNGGGGNARARPLGDNNSIDDPDFSGRVDEMEQLAKEIVGDEDAQNEDNGRELGPRPGGKGSKSRGKKGVGKGKDKGKTGPDAGIVTRVKVSNFMCHRLLSIDLGRQVNFINGRNGSGKSAILAALQICLGARASSTHRAKKLTDFIRQGWRGDAILEVTLLNSEQGYKYDEYGDSITIRRTIKQPNGGGFAMLDTNDNVLSRDRAELVRMLDILNIQVDNPCAVLDQENSKKFLQGSECDKYNFFMKATDLDRILKDSNEVKMDVLKMTKGHEEATDQLPRYRKLVQDLSNELKEFERIAQMEKKIKDYKEQLCWVHVNGAEDGVAEVDARLKEKKLRKNAHEEKIADLDAKLEQLASTTNASLERVEEGIAEVKRLKEALVKAHNEYKASRAPLTQQVVQREAIQNDLRSKQGAKMKAEREVKEARAKAFRNASGEREKLLLCQIEQLEQKLQVAATKREEFSDDLLNRLQEVIAPASDAFENAQRVLKDKQSELQDQDQYLRSISGARPDPLRLLGPGMPVLVANIGKNARRFRSPPVGPIAAFVQLKEEYKAFSVPIENVVRGCLNNFVVTCQQDKSELMKIMKTVRWGRGESMPTIIVQQAGPRYTPPEAPPGYLQVMQAISVSNDQAFNVLVDQVSIEKEALFKTKQEAESKCLIGQSGSYERMPHGLKAAFYMTANGFFSRFNITDGNAQTRMKVASTRDRRMLGVDQGTQLEDAKERRAFLEDHAIRARDIADAAKRHEMTAINKFNEARKQRQEIQSKEQMLLKQREKLSRELQKVKHAASANDPLQDLERNISGLKEEIDSLEQEMAVVDGQMEETKSQIKPYEAARTAANKAHQDAVTEQERALQQKTIYDDKHRETCAARARLQGVVKKFETEILSLEDEKREASSRYAEMVVKAEEYIRNLLKSQNKVWDGKRQSTKLSAEALNNKITALTHKKTQQVEKQDLSAKTKDKVEELLLNASDTYKEKKRLAETLASNVALLQQENRERISRWRQLKKWIERRTNTLFNDYLQKKGAAGEARFDGENKQLELTYQKDAGDPSSQCNDIKLLSGGERSFATLALLLALGAVHECPFRVMDEFDVFMDAVSRNIAIKAVIEFAHQFDQRQFIFITPQDLSSVTVGDTIKIFKMPTPSKGDRNQVTLEESFANA